MGDELYNHLEEKNLLPDEYKGCRRNSRGTKDQLLIDKLVIRNCKRRQIWLGMAWVDYKKAYDMIPHSCVDHQMSANVWSSREYHRVIGKKYESVENGISGRRTDLGQC